VSNSWNPGIHTPFFKTSDTVESNLEEDDEVDEDHEFAQRRPLLGPGRSHPDEIKPPLSDSPQAHPSRDSYDGVPCFMHSRSSSDFLITKPTGYFPDVCISAEPAADSPGIGYDVLEKYLNRLSQRYARPWKRSPQPAMDVPGGALPSPLKVKIHDSVFKLRNGKSLSKSIRLGRRYLFFSLEDGMVLTSNLEELVMGSLDTNSPKPQGMPIPLSFVPSSHLSLTPPDEFSTSPNSTYFRPLHEMLLHDGSWWIDIQSPTSEEMRLLGEVFHLHPLTMEDIFQGVDCPQETREKVEVFVNYYFCVVKAMDTEMIQFNFFLVRGPPPLIFNTG
jgi:hypothetical protein